MFLFTNLLESREASSSASGSAQSTALQVTSELVSKYHHVPPMIQSNSGRMKDTAPSEPSSQDLHTRPSILDVVTAEMKFEISFFRDYWGISHVRGQCYMLFTARLQRLPGKFHLVYCPQLIHAPNLPPVDRELLRIRLDAALDCIPKEEWDRLKSHDNITRKEWLIVLDA
jgi:hypothetical protein